MLSRFRGYQRKGAPAETVMWLDPADVVYFEKSADRWDDLSLCLIVLRTQGEPMELAPYMDQAEIERLTAMLEKPR